MIEEIKSSLFTLIKNKQWSDFIKKLNSSIDLNIQDELKNYLIQYIILFNNTECLLEILKYDIILDWIDNDGKTILYVPIKYNFIDIIKILINHDKKNIGSFILDTKDSNNYLPIHYTLKFKNLEAFKLLLDFSKLTVLDSNGNSLLHLAVNTRNIDFLNALTLKNYNINSVNYNNESALHIASIYDLNEIIKKLVYLGININIREKQNGFTSLILLLLNGNTEMALYLLKQNADINIYDNYGNSALHIAIMEMNYEIISYIIENCKIDYNLVNSDGNTYLHLILDNINNQPQNLNKYNSIISNLLSETTLNIQNNDGKTPWHYLCEMNIFNVFKNVLIKTFNNVFINDNKNKSPFSYVKSDMKNTFIDLIVESYYNILLNPNIKWSEEWENKCKGNKKECLEKIRNVILNENKSLPIKETNYNIIIEDPKYINFTTFTGISFDVLLSYIFITKKYSNKLFTSITEDFMDNPNVAKYYLKLGIIKDLENEYLNFEIFWIFQQLIMPLNINKSIEEFINSDKTIMAIPIAIELEMGAHANLLIIDKNNKIIERFEPSGKLEPYNYNYNPKSLDNLLKMYFEKYFPSYVFLTPNETQPVIGFQSLEMYETDRHKKIGDPGGFCVVWCIWYLEQRLKYDMVSPLKLAQKLIIKIKTKNISFKKLIRSYSTNILDVRNKILEQLEIDINDVRNNNLTHSQIENLQKLIKHELLF